MALAIKERLARQASGDAVLAFDPTVASSPTNITLRRPLSITR